MRVWSCIAAVIGFAATTPFAAAQQTIGSLEVIDASQLTFSYTVDIANKKNWIGLYHSSGGGPINEKHVKNSVKWAWAPEASGIVSLSTNKLEPGEYQAFLLSDSGYKWLAEPVDVALPVRWMVNDIVTQNARVGDAFKASVAGLLHHKKVEFSLTSASEDWVKISGDGTIYGTPGPDAQDTEITILATVKTKTSVGLGDIEVTIPVVAAGQPLVSRLRVMTFNTWQGGRHVNSYHEKQISFMAGSGADVIGFQESNGGHATRIGKALGWHSWQGRDVGVISRYPILDHIKDKGFAGAVTIGLGDGKKISVWNAHLGYTPYGPYDFCYDHKSVKQVMRNEYWSKRAPQIIKTMGAMEKVLENSDNVPVIFVGDMNAPSHLDWTEANKAAHCNVGNVPWPTSKYPIDAGLTDSYREIHPDPVKEPGNTWSPIYLKNKGRDEPMDRIDFIYYKGNITVVDSQTIVVGNPTPQPHQKNNQWPTDHAAVMTEFNLEGGARSDDGFVDDSSPDHSSISDGFKIELA